MRKTLLAVMLVLAPALAFGESFTVQRVSTAVPFPRGLVLLDGKLYTLARGRVRSNGGVSADVEDRAGSLWVVDPSIVGPTEGEPTEAVKANGAVIAEPTSPPFKLWDRTSVPVESDRQTDRPYCCMRYDPASKSFLHRRLQRDRPEGAAGQAGVRQELHGRGAAVRHPQRAVERGGAPRPGGRGTLPAQ